MWRANLLLILLAAASVSLDLAVWASYPEPRTEFPGALLALLIGQTTLLTLWAVYGRAYLVLRLPLLIGALVVLTAVGDRLQLWGPRDSMRLFDALVLVVAAKTAVVAAGLMLLRATCGLHLMRYDAPIFPSPSGRGSEERAVREMPRAEESPERFTIEREPRLSKRSASQFSLTWLFDLTAAIALALMLWRFVPAQLPRDPDTLATMLQAILLFVAVDSLLLLAVLPNRLSWLKVTAVSVGLSCVPAMMSGPGNHPLWYDCRDVLMPMVISLAVSLVIVRVAGFRWRFERNKHSEHRGHGDGRKMTMDCDNSLQSSASD